MRTLAIATALLAASCSPAPVRPPPAPIGAIVTLGRAIFRVEWIGRGRSREDILKLQPPLQQDAGILVGYDHDRIQHHHTDGGRADFDVAWISGDGQVVETAKLPADSEEGVTSQKEARYALFLAPGRGPAAGEKAVFSRDILEAPASGPPAIGIGAATLHVELSVTVDQRCRGLMHRRRMSADDGMLFAYPAERDLAYWMGSCHYPLDIAFFDGRGKLLNVVTINPYPDPKVDTGERATSGGKARYVVEANAGWFRAHQVKAGAELRLPADVAAAVAEAE